SSSKNSARPARPASPAPATGADPQPRTGASINANTTPARPSVAAAAPATSTGSSAPAPRLSGTLARHASSSSAPIGTVSRNAQQEDALAPEAVAEGAAHQQQGRQEQRVGLDEPLRIGARRAQVALDRRQRDVDDRAVHEGHARAEHRAQERPALDGRRRGTG